MPSNCKQTVIDLTTKAISTLVMSTTSKSVDYWLDIIQWIREVNAMIGLESKKKSNLLNFKGKSRVATYSCSWCRNAGFCRNVQNWIELRIANSISLILGANRSLAKVFLLWSIYSTSFDLHWNYVVNKSTIMWINVPLSSTFFYLVLLFTSLKPSTANRRSFSNTRSFHLHHHHHRRRRHCSYICQQSYFLHHYCVTMIIDHHRNRHRHKYEVWPPLQYEVWSQQQIWGIITTISTIGWALTQRLRTRHHQTEKMRKTTLAERCLASYP